MVWMKQTLSVVHRKPLLRLFSGLKYTSVSLQSAGSKSYHGSQRLLCFHRLHRQPLQQGWLAVHRYHFGVQHPLGQTVPWLWQWKHMLCELVAFWGAVWGSFMVWSDFVSFVDDSCPASRRIILDALDKVMQTIMRNMLRRKRLFMMNVQKHSNCREDFVRNRTDDKIKGRIVLK